MAFLYFVIIFKRLRPFFLAYLLLCQYYGKTLLQMNYQRLLFIFQILVLPLPLILQYGLQVDLRHLKLSYLLNLSVIFVRRSGKVFVKFFFFLYKSLEALLSASYLIFNIFYLFVKSLLTGLIPLSNIKKYLVYNLRFIFFLLRLFFHFHFCLLKLGKKESLEKHNSIGL